MRNPFTLLTKTTPENKTKHEKSDIFFSASRPEAKLAATASLHNKVSISQASRIGNRVSGRCHTKSVKLDIVKPGVWPRSPLMAH